MKHLRSLIREVLYRGRAPDGTELEIDAPNTKIAGDLVAQQIGGGIDPFTIDIQPINDAPAQTGSPRRVAAWVYPPAPPHRVWLAPEDEQTAPAAILFKHDGSVVASLKEILDWIHKHGITHMGSPRDDWNADPIYGDHAIDIQEWLDDWIRSGKLK